MKKRITALFLLVCMLLTLLPVGALADEDEGTPTPVVEPAAPENGGGETHTHTFTNWKDDQDGKNHTGTCECGQTKTEPHQWGSYTDKGETHERTCSVCHAVENVAHSWGDLKDLDNGKHGYACADCGATKDAADHTWGNLKDLGNGKHGRVCADCKATLNAEQHSWSAWQQTEDGKQHIHSCTVCEASETEDHIWGAWVDKGDTHERTCQACGAIETGTHDTYTYTPNGDETTHTRKCATCGKVLNASEDCDLTDATCAAPATCKLCGQTSGTVSPSHTGKSIYKANTDGTTHSLVCETCGNPLSDVKDPHKEAAKPRPVAGTKTHEYYCEVCQAATRNAENCTPKCVSNKDGTHNVVCKDCGQTLEENVACTPNKTNVKCGTAVKCTVCSGNYKLPHDRDANGACKRFSTDSKKNKCSCTADSHQTQWTKANANQDTLTCPKCGNTIQKKEIDVSINISGYKEDNKPSNLSASSSNANVKPGKPIGVTPNDAKFQKGKKYAVTVPFEVEPGYKVKSLKISGVTVTPMQLDDGSWVATAELPAVEEMVTLTFKTNGGKTMSPLNVTKGTKITKDELTDKYTPTRSGYWFCGWYKESTFKTKVTQLTVNEDTTIYAKWKKEDTTNPKTGDTIGLAVGVLALTTVLGAAVVTKKKRTR